MKAQRLSLTAISLVVFLAGCTPAAPPLTPPDTRDADAKAIKGVEAAWVQAFTTKDVDKVAAYYSDDASVFRARQSLPEFRQSRLRSSQ